MSEVRKGVPKSEDFKIKRKKASVGEKNPMFGKHHSEESKQKMRMRPDTSGENNPMFGKHRFGEDSPNHNRIWINNGTERKMVKKSDSLEDGWKIGWKFVS